MNRQLIVKYILWGILTLPAIGISLIFSGDTHN